MRKILAMLLTIALVLSFAVPVFAEGEKSDDIVILYTNDVHTYIDGDLSYDVLAAIKAKYDSLYNNVILVDAGDHSIGKPCVGRTSQHADTQQQRNQAVKQGCSLFLHFAYLLFIRNGMRRFKIRIVGQLVHSL